MANFSLLAKLGLDTKAYQKGLKNAQGKTNVFMAAAKKLGPILATVGFTSLAKQAIDLGSRLSDLAIKLNISVEALQVLRFASQEAGTKAEVLNRAIRNVQLRTEEAAKGVTSYADAFTVLGISVSEFKQLPIEERFVKIADALKDAEDKQAAYNAVSRILGEKAGPELMEVLKRLSDEGFDGIAQSAKDAGQVMSEDTAQRLDIFADRIEKLKTAFVIAAANITAKFLPVLYVLEGVVGIVGAAFKGLSEKIGSFVKFLNRIGESLVKPFTSIADSVFLVFEALNTALRGNLPKAKKLLEDAKNKIEDSFEELKRCR